MILAAWRARAGRVLAGLRPSPGVGWLLLARAALAVLGAVSVWAVLREALAGPCGSGACGPEPGRQDLVGVVTLLMAGGPAAAAAVLAAAVGFWLCDQVLTAAALRLACAHARGEAVPTVRAALRGALPRFATFLRIAFASALCAAVLIGGLDLALDPLADRAVVRGAVGTARLSLVAVQAAAALAAAAGVAALGFWCRVLSVADDRYRVRRTVLIVARLAWRRPIAGVGFTAATALLATAISAPFAVAPAPWSPAGADRIAAWLVLSLPFVAWWWRIGAAARVYADPALADLWARPDAPLGVLALGRRLASAVRARLGRPSRARA